MENEQNKEPQESIPAKKKWFAPYVAASLIFGAGTTFAKTLIGGEIVLVVVAIGAGFLWYPLKSKIKIKNEAVRIIITFLILEIIAGALVGVLAGVTNALVNKASSNTEYQAETQTSAVSQQTGNDKLPQILLDEVLQRTVKVTCKSSTHGSQGSGFIAVTSEDSNEWFVFTNTHVAIVGPPKDNDCVVGVPSSPSYSINKNFGGKIVDTDKNFPMIDKAVLLVTGDRGFRNAKDVMPLCEFSGVKIGDKVIIAGYPAFGGSSLTVTEGIVSGFEETQYGPIYKTSAKIDSGNSGGTAVDSTKRCFLGMPTWATQGTFEGLGYIQSWEMINNAN